MGPNELIGLAIDCGMTVSRGGNGYWDNPDQLKRLADAIASAERKACLALAEEHEARLRKAADAAWHANPHFAFTAKADSVATVADDIRARARAKQGEV